MPALNGRPVQSRPVGARFVAYVATGCLVAMFVAVTVLLPPDIRATFTPSQTGTLLLCLAAAAAVLLGIARSHVRTDDDGVHVRNGYRTHDVAWADVEGVSFRRGAPWATLVLRDGTTRMMVGIQGSDGDAAASAVRALRAELAERR